MALPRCPGMDIRFWKPKDIFELRCPYCGNTIEFWKDDPKRLCSECGKIVTNPHIDLGCAKWCQYAEECLGATPEASSVMEAPVIDRLRALLELRLREQPERVIRARNVCNRAETIMVNEGGEPCIVKSAALIAGSLIAKTGGTDQQVLPDEHLCNLQEQKCLLEEAGLEVPLAERICSLVGAIFADKHQESQEFSVVWDAVQLERSGLVLETGYSAVSPEILMKTLKTQSGKQMAEQIRSA